MVILACYNEMDYGLEQISSLQKKFKSYVKAILKLILRNRREKKKQEKNKLFQTTKSNSVYLLTNTLHLHTKIINIPTVKRILTLFTTSIFTHL